MVDDLMAVLDEVGSERTALFGYEEQLHRVHGRGDPA
jgi:hypothetical protein